MADIAKNALNWHTLEVRVRRYQALIETHVKADGRKLYSNEAFDPAGCGGSSKRAARSC